MTILLLFLLGGITGLLAGYLGIGGGIILVPVFTELFLAKGLDLDHTMTAAFATSLLTAVFTTAAAAWRQWRQDNLLPRAIPLTAVGAIAGGQLGSYLGCRLSGGLLMIMFGAFLFLAAVNLWHSGKKSNDAANSIYNLPALFALGLVTGIIGALFGVGGGIVMVPAFILLFKFPSGKVAGTSSAIACLMALSGVTGYLAYGAGRTLEMPGFWGVIDISTGVPVAIGTVLSAQFGAKLNKKYGGIVYQRIFAVFLAFIAIRMLIKSF